MGDGRERGGWAEAANERNAEVERGVVKTEGCQSTTWLGSSTTVATPVRTLVAVTSTRQRRIRNRVALFLDIPPLRRLSSARK